MTENKLKSRDRLELVTTLEGHDDRVWCVKWHPSGKFLASCSADRTIKLWGEEGNRWLCLSTLSDAHERTIRSIAWSHDGRFLASSSFDGSTCIWHKTSSRANQPLELNSNNAANETEWSVLVSLEGHENEVKCCAWSANDKYLATCSRDKTVWVWEVIGETNTQKEAERKELADSLRTTSDEDSMKNQKRDHHSWPSTRTTNDTATINATLGTLSTSIVQNATRTTEDARLSIDYIFPSFFHYIYRQVSTSKQCLPVNFL